MKTTFFSISLSLLSLSANANPFLGTYLPQSEKEKGATCDSLAGSSDGKTPYRIEEGWIEYMESGCKLSELSTPMGGSVRYQASCATEGTEYSEIIEVTPFDDGSGILLKGGDWREVWSLCTVPPVEARRNPVFEFHSRYAEALVETLYSNLTIQDFVDEMKSLDLMDDGEARNYVYKFPRIIDRVEIDDLNNPRLVECLDRQATNLTNLGEQIRPTAQAILNTGYPGVVVNLDRLKIISDENQEDFLRIMVLGRTAVILCLAEAELKSE